MNSRTFARPGLAVATALSLLSLSSIAAKAQTVTYSTAGAFSGGTGATTCSATQCAVDGFTLTFNNAPSASYIAPTLVDLGQFVTAYANSDGTAPATAFTGVNFTLMIQQTGPT